MRSIDGLLRPQALVLLALAFFSFSHTTYSFPNGGGKGQAIQEAPATSSGDAGSSGVTSAPYNNDNGPKDGADRDSEYGDSSEVGADAKVPPYVPAEKGSDDSDNSNGSDVKGSNNYEEDNNDGSDVKGSDDSGDSDGSDVKGSNNYEDNNDGTDVKGSDDNDNSDGSDVKGSDNYKEDNNDGTDVKGSDGVNGTDIKGPGASSGVKDYPSAPGQA